MVYRPIKAHNHEEDQQSFGSLFTTKSSYIANIKLITMDTISDLNQKAN